MAGSGSIDAAKPQLRPALDRSQFPVFVFGPALDPDQPVPMPTLPVDGHENIGEHARYLRYQTKLRLEELGYTVDFGESPDVLAFWQRFFGAPGPAAAEVLHARKMCGAIVIFPASFGSMAELALFAIKPPIAEKTIAIVHQTYEDDKSFFRRGLLELFDSYNGRVQYLDYANPDVCVGYAVRYVEGKYCKKCGEVDDYRDLKSRNRGSGFEQALES